MSVKEHTREIIEELLAFVDYEKDQELDQLVDAILQAKNIFLSGAGRSGVAITGFTNRLLHLGLPVHLAGEISCPRTAKGDLLIIGSGSGTTPGLVTLAKKAKSNGVSLALLTMDKESEIAQLADVVVVLPGVSPKLKENNLTSIQPMGSAFEQISFLTYDGIILELMERMGETGETMVERHTDLE
ncbi:6-phospho-3-hexuloisomerase [Enterococcus malodoratus]|uniref:6-phospho 3-hexuloisomerase n=1 Tax=Enterococcus malodoratus ATCC 43197 TaxID=1158601 RepID=R2PC91_9ENTE|nr:6-phospho-3-hexuloisomerase [Enterococcus malodoratus]EOH80808.1 6-phospho 3-hexuloisomerase [Enterococcus malodoratus ATCC 43197]EOT69317.1 6-phospho 3-hexuloisomerase [Enterococcus malodoratus ATCC 43197]OJG63327.1 6-phospho 3-hexuloisomerase [Enterococcus malodoratus]SPW68604.1 6-phospho 3-hexuloisomerase [Enterococcus malodoratus]STC71329.1 6-phospho 3-hexuloisomerase [Enterococcus malodoratus]